MDLALRTNTIAPIETAFPVDKRQSVIVPFILSLLLVIFGFWFSRPASIGESEYTLTLRSMLIATMAGVPLLFQAILSERSRFEKIAILMWWPLKMCFTLCYYFYIWDTLHNLNPFLLYSDNIAFHEMALRVSAYWHASHTVWLPWNELVRLSINYPTAAYLFGSMYYFLGPFPGVVLPWLSLFTFASAIMAQNLVRSTGVPLLHAKVAFHFVLWSPVLWLFTVHLFRDIYMILSLFVFFVGILRVIYGRVVSGFVAAAVAAVCLLNLRAEYLFVLLAWVATIPLIIAVRSERMPPARKVWVVAGCLIFMVLGVWLLFNGEGVLYLSKYSLMAKTFSQFNKYAQGGAVGTGWYAWALGLGIGFFIPIAVPFKFLIGLVAPFPWRFSPFELLVTQPFYSLESILRLSLVYFTIIGLNRRHSSRQRMSFPALLLTTMGVIVAVGGIVGPQVEGRYLAPAIPFFAPLFAPMACKAKNWVRAIFLAIMFIVALHFVYILTGGTI